MIQLDRNDTKPLFKQIKEKTKELIIKGALGENEKIPSVREAAAYLAINPNTIQKAYKELENEGYLYCVKGKGYFVSSVTKLVKENRIAELKKELEKIFSELSCLGAEKESISKIINKYFKEDAQWLRLRMFPKAFRALNHLTN